MPEFDTDYPPLSPEEILAARKAIDPILLPLLKEIRGTLVQNDEEEQTEKKVERRDLNQKFGGASR